MRVLTLHAPWASLCVTRQPSLRRCSVGCENCDPAHPFYDPTWHPFVKRFETRSRPCPPHLIGQRIAIHQAAKQPNEGTGIGRYWVTPRPDLALPDGTPLPGRWLLCDWDDPDEVAPVPLPLGAIVGTAVIARNLPIIAGTAEDDWTAPCIVVEGETLRQYDALLSNGRDISDQSPYGDWTPGRHAYELVDVEPLAEPVPFKGGQGWSKTWEPS